MPTLSVAGRRLLKDICVGWVITFLLIAVKTGFEHTEIGHDIERLAVDWLHRELRDGPADEDCAAVICNIGPLPQIPLASGEAKVTPATKLGQIVAAIAEVYPPPLCIVIDIDFSTVSGEPKHITHATFLADCERLMRETKIPIVVGVYKTRKMGPEHWLPEGEKYQHLAGSLTIPEPANYLQYSIQGDSSAEELLSVSARAADVRREDLSSAWAPEWLARPFQTRAVPDAVTTEYIVNYRCLPLLTRSAVEAASAEAVLLYQDRFKGKMVFLGDLGAASSDKFVVAGRAEAVSGVLIHACGALTLREGGLFQLTQGGRIVMDLLFAAVVIFVTMALRIVYIHFKKSVHLRIDRLNRFLSFAMAGLVLFLGFCVNHTSLVWTDFVLVALCLVIHDSVHHALPRGWQRLCHWWKNFETKSKRGA